MHHAPTRRAVEAAPSSGRRPWSLLILLCAAQFMVIVDMTVVNVALPSIGRALGFSSAADLQWVVTAYVLVSGGLVLLGGRIADLLGGRPVFLLGLLLFTAASLASGLATAPAVLVVSRAAQGLGAALLTPAALSLITTLCTAAHSGPRGWRPGARSAGPARLPECSWAASSRAGSVGSGSSSSMSRSASPSRPSPGGWCLPGRRGGRLRDLDITGALAATADLVLLVYAIEGAATYGWGSARTLGSLLLSVGLLVAFAAIERGVARPLVAPAIWRVRALVSGVVVMLGATGIMGGAFFLNSLYLQRVLGASALEAGLAFLPFAVVVAVAAHLSSRLLPRFGTRSVLVLGLLVTASGALLLARVSDHATYLLNVLPGFLALGIGLGLSFVAVLIGAMAEVGSDHAGLASGLMTTAHEIGAALGVALLSAVATACTGPAGFTIGYRAGLLVAACIAGAGAAIALVAVPAVRPEGAARMGLHGG